MNIKVRLATEENWLKNCGYSLEEEAYIYDAQLNDMLDHTLWYLDNFETLPTYRVRWKHDKSKTPTIPYKYVGKGKAL